MRLIDAEQIGLTDMEIFMCDGNYKKALEMLIDKIAYAPTIEVPQRMRGKWIGGELGRCSVCGHEGNASDIWNGCKGMFCPNCGADMRGTANDD